MRSPNSAISVEANHRCSIEMMHPFSFQQPWKPELLLSEFERWESRYAGADYAFGKEPNYSAAGRGLTQARRASDTKAESRHLPPGSGDVGQDERRCPVHEVREHLVLHPRGHRPAPEARRAAAVGMDLRPAAKGVTDPAPAQAMGDVRATFAGADG